MKKKYWLQSGTIFVLLYILLVIIIIPKNVFINMDEFTLGLVFLSYPISLIESLLGIVPNYVPVLIINGIVTWFIMGGLIGLIYGKIRKIRTSLNYKN